MLKIKLQRTGKRGQPQYRIVVAEARSKSSGQYIDLLGIYNPRSQPSEFSLNKDKYQAWLKKGAQPTDTVRQFADKS